MLRTLSPVLIPLFAVGLCAAADSKFADGLYPVLQKSNCRTCHVDGGIASATRLLFPEPGASAGQIEAFGRSLGALVNRDQPQASLLFTKPTNREKHTGGKLISPGSPEETLLLDWVRQLAGLAPALDPECEIDGEARTGNRGGQPTASMGPHRPTCSGIRLNPPNSFPEDFVNGFQNQADAQSIPALLAEAFAQLRRNLRAMPSGRD